MADNRTGELFPYWRGDQALPIGFIEDFRRRHDEVAAAWYDSYPQLDAALGRQDPWRGYSYWSEAAARLSAGRSDTWHCGFLLWNIDRFDATFAELGLANEFRYHFVDVFHRIFERVETAPGFVSHERDWYLKDLGVTRGTLIPAVARLLYPYTGVPLSSLIRRPRAAWYVAARCGGRRPFFGLHVHQPMAKDYFGPAGWSECLRLATLALNAFPRIRGIMGASWFYDPAVASFSPHLTYLCEEPARYGAQLLALGTSKSAIDDATSTSRTRLEAYQRGRYRPQVHALIWSREDMLDRAAQGASPSAPDGSESAAPHSRGSPGGC